jgi:hypothetical protein
MKVLARKERLKALFERADRRLHDDIVLSPFGRSPDNQADCTGRLAVDQHFSRLDDDRIGNRRIGHGDSNNLKICQKHSRPASGEWNALCGGCGRNLLLRGG